MCKGERCWAKKILDADAGECGLSCRREAAARVLPHPGHVPRDQYEYHPDSDAH